MSDYAEMAGSLTKDKTDRELLELAAKAAGIEIYWEKCLTNAGSIFRPHLKINGTWGHGQWNPLTEDGDALRLAVTLRLNVYHADSGVYAEDEESTIAVRESHGSDPYAATRRAIVRDAAAIGESME